MNKDKAGEMAYRQVGEYCAEMLMNLHHQVRDRFPHIKQASEILNHVMLGDAPFLLLCDGLTRQEIEEAFRSSMDDNFKLYKEFQEKGEI